MILKKSMCSWTKSRTNSKKCNARFSPCALRRCARARLRLAPAPADNSESVQKMLANAQRVCDETMSDARKQADLIVADAKAKADRLVAEAKAESKRLQDGLDTLRSAASDYRARFRRLVEDQQHVLNAESELFK